MQKIRRGDKVLVITGKDKGKFGEVLTIRPDKKLIVSGINMIKKHQKPNPNLNITGGIVEKEAAIDVSNVAIFNKETKKSDRVGFKFSNERKKHRIFKSTGKPIDALRVN